MFRRKTKQPPRPVLMPHVYRDAARRTPPPSELLWQSGVLVVKYLGQKTPTEYPIKRGYGYTTRSRWETNDFYGYNAVTPDSFVDKVLYRTVNWRFAVVKDANFQNNNDHYYLPDTNETLYKAAMKSATVVWHDEPSEEDYK